MQDESNQDQPDAPPRVTADYGGRRKGFERRLKKGDPGDADRRSGKDRRSGFDRRSACNDKSGNFSEKRNHSLLNQK